MREIVEALLLKNRTIVSADSEWCIAQLAKEIPLTVHRFPSGSEHGTWIIPPQWDVKRAVVSDGERVIASYDDHPLFLAPYSVSFTGWVSREELLAHIRTSPQTPDAFVYEYRLAYNFQRRLKEWVISLPYRVVQSLDKPRYFVDLQVETASGHMLVAESLLPGRTGFTFAFLTHIDHPGQANDGLAGVAIGVEVMRRLRTEFPQPTSSYQLLINPETIGTAAYLAAREDKVDAYLGSVFIEMAGIRSPLRVGRTRRHNTYLDRVLTEAVRRRGVPFIECDFLKHWGNDELVFDSAGVGIPGAAIERYPFQWYHTSGDDLSVTDEAALEEIVEVLLDTVRLIEADFIPRPRQRIPVYLTRFSLYADWQHERVDHDLNHQILNSLWSGLSVFDIAHLLQAPFQRVHQYVMQFVEHGLVDRLPLTPEYYRRVGVPADG